MTDPSAAPNPRPAGTQPAAPHETELTAPVSLTLPSGRLNPASIGFARSPLVDTSGIGGRHGWGRNKRWEYWNVMTPAHIVALTVSSLDYAAVHEVWIFDRATAQTWGRSATVIPVRDVALPGTLAGGIAIARAMILRPKVVVLDEPVNGLDPEGIRWVRQLVRALADEGRTILISSHLLSEMSQTADHLVVIGKGRLVADQPTYDFVKDHSESSVLVRSDHLDAFGSALRAEGISFTESTDEEGRPRLVIANQTTDFVGQLAYSTGVPLNELSLKSASLEDAFMELTGDAVQYHGSTGAPNPGIAGTAGAATPFARPTQQEV